MLYFIERELVNSRIEALCDDEVVSDSLFLDWRC